MPTEVGIGVAQLAPDGVQVWTDIADVAGQGLAWVLHQRMARSLTRVGWHVVADEEQVLVLGWSTRCLSHRARLLRGALQGRLADFWATAQHAVACTAQVHGARERPAHADIVTAACAEVTQQLGWPQRLADLDGWQRTSAVADQQLLLAQVVGLEAKVRRACQEHLVIARLVADTACRQFARTGPGRSARRQVLEAARPWLRARQILAASADLVGNPLPTVAGGPAASLTDRVIAASVAIGRGSAAGSGLPWS
ncbi:MAG TPA: hypothetical protein VFV66_35895 [Nonomuraea sp.]|nr:hypothetical protein [Nonomuraea sp.]